jgi:hypothetical protein
MKITKLKRDKSKNIIGEAAIFDDEDLGCEFVLVARNTGDLQRLMHRYSSLVGFDTRICKTVKVIPANNG